MTTPATIKRRLERLESWRPLPPLADVLGPHAEFCMRVFENVCVDCSDRVKYPRCPDQSCEQLSHARDLEAATLSANDPREKAMLDGAQAWREQRLSRSEWLTGGFFLFAYEDDQKVTR